MVLSLGLRPIIMPLATNVPKTANLAVDPASIPDELVFCVQACIEAVQHVVKRDCLVLDASNEIFDEYRQQLSMFQ